MDVKEEIFDFHDSIKKRLQGISAILDLLIDTPVESLRKDTIPTVMEQLRDEIDDAQLKISDFLTSLDKD